MSALFGALALLAAGAWFIRARYESLAVVSVQKVAQITNWSGLDDFSALAPDGRRIAFATCRNMNGKFCNIWLMNADGSNQIQLTSDENNALTPSWFPDMEQVAYASTRTGHWTLWVINLNTKREKICST